MKGQCTCEEVQYELSDKPLFVHACHCTWCQRQSGTAFAMNAMIEASKVSIISGEPEAIDLPTKSGQGQRMYRCPACKVALWSAYLGLGEDIVFVRVGTLEEANDCPPDIHIFTANKQPWVLLNEDVPAREGYYNRAKYWSEEALARFQAVMDARD
jgi:hypothetical protein